MVKKHTENKMAESDVNTTPTEAMSINATRGLKYRKEFNRGGTIIGVTRANQLVKRENLSPSTVRRMHSYFSRHEVDKKGQGFKRGEKGFPSAGLVAWLLWGGDAGQSWAKSKAGQLDNERNKKPKKPKKSLTIDEKVALLVDFISPPLFMPVSRVRQTKAKIGSVKVGDMVAWNSSGGRARGKVSKIVKTGKVKIPKTTITLNASEDDPVALITLYRGSEPTETVVGHKIGTLRKL
tara:strand:+ start:2549 stop:3259 length:711 start_codon:yes stop_codon:yes gene_type:complete